MEPFSQQWHEHEAALYWEEVAAIVDGVFADMQTLRSEGKISNAKDGVWYIFDHLHASVQESCYAHDDQLANRCLQYSKHPCCGFATTKKLLEAQAPTAPFPWRVLAVESMYSDCLLKAMEIVASTLKAKDESSSELST
jgi:hypothetical protein